jgi:exonuclease III
VRSAGVAVLFKSSLKLVTTFHDDAGRLVIAHFSDPSCDSSPFQVVSIYGPNRRQLGEDFFTSILPQIDPSLPTFLCGDFNTVVDPHINRRGCNPSSYWAYNWPQSLSLLTSQLDLVDAWRRSHPTDRHFTWHRPCSSQASRLDMVWISSNLLEHVNFYFMLHVFDLLSTMVSLSFTIRCQNTCVPNWKDYKKELLESSVQTLITKTP